MTNSQYATLRAHFAGLAGQAGSLQAQVQSVLETECAECPEPHPWAVALEKYPVVGMRMKVASEKLHEAWKVLLAASADLRDAQGVVSLEEPSEQPQRPPETNVAGEGEVFTPSIQQGEGS